MSQVIFSQNNSIIKTDNSVGVIFSETYFEEMAQTFTPTTFEIEKVEKLIATFNPKSKDYNDDIKKKVNLLSRGKYFRQYFGFDINENNKVKMILIRFIRINKNSSPEEMRNWEIEPSVDPNIIELKYDVNLNKFYV